MIKQIMYFFLSILLFIPIQLLGNDDIAYILRNRIKKIDNFYSFFIQNIGNMDGNVIKIGQGELWIKQPNLFHLHIINPEEIFLISDGKTLWFYMPAIKQVTAFCLKNSIVDNFFLKLLFDYDISEYKKYNINQKKNWFYFTPILDHDLSLKEFNINITDHGIINQFILIEPDKQYVEYILSNQCVNLVNIDNKFSFTVPKDIQLDDQQ